MLAFLGRLVAPYILVAHTAAYALAQNTQALGLDSAWEGMHIDPGSMALEYTLYFLLAMAGTAVVTLVAGGFVSRVAFKCIVALWILPGGGTAGRLRCCAGGGVMREMYGEGAERGQGIGDRGQQAKAGDEKWEMSC